MISTQVLFTITKQKQQTNNTNNKNKQQSFNTNPSIIFPSISILCVDDNNNNPIQTH